MPSIAFIDTEVHPQSLKILDIGCIKSDESIFHKASATEFIHFLKGTEFVCGHNIILHDIRYLGNSLHDAGINPANTIDTLFLSPLLFPVKPYHRLVKDDKLQTEERNNPLNDSIKARDLFYEEVAAFQSCDDLLKQILYLLLHDTPEFRGFFRFVGYTSSETDIQELVRQKFKEAICAQADLKQMVSEQPIALAYCLSLINTFITEQHILSITPPWVLKSYPEVERIMFRLRNSPCLAGCSYCNSKWNIHSGLKRLFGFDTFRTYAGEPLQEKTAEATVNNKSVLAIFPTGGGKSLTFQLPALMSGENSRGLTIVISPLQSLMKDQVDNLEKNGITSAVTINGLLDPIERAKAFDRVEDGSASILYISPESLRSPSIERLILGRKIVRIVIDEAHCFSAWGHDFRVDYLYIGDFIKAIQKKKNLSESIPVSCFTATARQKVIEDIRNYFKDKLSLDLELFSSKASRTNLHYSIFAKGTEDEKYLALRDLIETKHCPTIVYVSRTKKAYSLAKQLTENGLLAKPYHGKMDAKEKTANQDAFISGEVDVMVATSAFGMGVDKKDVGMVIHYDISDSLENYVQEAGRAGRDESIEADCFVLFSEEDLSKHFILLNQTKLSIKEIQQVWKAIKDITRFRSKVSNSALEIARKAGWDDSVMQIETRVTTAIAALEDAGYLKRGQNMPRIFASSILSKTAQEAIDKINASSKFDEHQKIQAQRIIKSLFSSKSRKQPSEDSGESRIDYLSDRLAIEKENVIAIVNLMREEQILANTQDLIAYIRRADIKNRSLNIVETFCRIENFLLSEIAEEEKTFHIKALNEEAEAMGCTDVNPNRIKTILNFWAIKNWIKRQNAAFSKNHIVILGLHPTEMLKSKQEKRHELARFIVELLYERSKIRPAEEDADQEEALVEFSVHELKEAYEGSQTLFKKEISIDDIEDTLFYLSRIDAMRIEGGFLVLYNRLTIERLEQNNRKSYTKEDYQKLHDFYENKVQQIHIVGEYARKMLSDYKDALQFVDDYFQLNYSSFIRKYFPGGKEEELKLRITPTKFKQLFGELSPTQLKIIKDNDSRYIAVAAGPGSGKTRILVHKLASLLLMEDVKHEQLLMLTFSRAAATEFKKRLLTLIGNAAYYVNIKTFHSYCFDLLGKVGSLEKSGAIVRKAIEAIKSREVESNRITIAVLVIDEAQDMDADEYGLIETLMEQNEEMRVIAVGDDDQNIYEFRGSNSKHLEDFIRKNKATTYELLENFRSRSNLVAFTNQFVQHIKHRLKQTPIIARQTDNGNISVVRYNSTNLIAPVVSDILRTGLRGTTCVLTATNHEALQITRLLFKLGAPAKLIQSNDSFNLYQLLEVRFLLDQLKKADELFIINDDLWTKTLQELSVRFHNGTGLEICKNIIRNFEAINQKKKYKSDLDAFIRESKLEDFFQGEGETIYVSTMHKAKGKEFDNIFLMLDHFNATKDEAKRLLYVAMTRAKQNLTIHLNSGFLDNFTADNLERTRDDHAYLPATEIAMHLGMEDIWLDYFINNQVLISQLKSGDMLLLDGAGCRTTKGQPVLRFSKQFGKKIQELKGKGYEPKSAKVNFIVYWLKDGTEQEVMVVLPEVLFERSTNTV